MNNSVTPRKVVSRNPLSEPDPCTEHGPLATDDSSCNNLDSLHVVVRSQPKSDESPLRRRILRRIEKTGKFVQPRNYISHTMGHPRPLYWGPIPHNGARAASHVTAHWTSRARRMVPRRPAHLPNPPNLPNLPTNLPNLPNLPNLSVKNGS